MTMYKFIGCLVALSTICNVLPIVRAETSDDETLVQNLLEWGRANGAYVNEKLEHRRIDPNDPTSPRGVFTSGRIEAGEILYDLPWSIMLGPQVEGEWGEDEDLPDDIFNSNCETTHAVIDAMTKKGDKKISAYGEYLLAQPRKYIPQFWTSTGKDLLLEILGPNLPPRDLNSALEEWKEFCEGATDDPFEMHALMLVTARADYQYMIPFYDMINHDNGKYNINHLYRYEDMIKRKRMGVNATEVIEAGGQIFGSYNRCNICNDRYDHFGTPEMFRDYGFVDAFPQQWLFDFARTKFVLDRKDGSLEANFRVPPSERGMRLLREELTRLEKFDLSKVGNSIDVVPKGERIGMLSYYFALTGAIRIAVESGAELSDDVWAMGDDWWVQDGTSTAADSDEHSVRTSMGDGSMGDEL